MNGFSGGMPDDGMLRQRSEFMHRTPASPMAPSPSPRQGDWIFDAPTSAGYPTGQAAAWQQPVRPFAPGTTQPAYAPVAVSARPVEAAEILAWVGDEFILAGEVLGTVDQILEDNRDQIPESMWDAQRRLLMQEALKRLIQNKLVLVDAKRNLPKAALPGIEQRVNESFEKTYILHLMKEMKATSRADLETKLFETGSSMARQRRVYFERSLSAYWMGEKTKDESQISYAELYDYYRQHVADFEHQGKARWEQLTARFTSYPSKQAAYQAIADMGNDVVVRRIPFAEVAKAKSNGVTSLEGGRQDWTTQGSLKSKVINRALFSLPEGMLSDIIEDDDGLHIIRVTKRQVAHATPFRDAQVEIRDKIRKQRKKKNVEQFYAALRNEVRIWTVFDDTASRGRPPQF
jgi:parvulin-like peptidyl-prolyl isomerase